jgi:Lipopolysaccharide-assembly
MRFAKLVLPVLILMFGGCGYQLATKRANAGEGRTIAVPTFTNFTTTYRIEQRMTESLRRELVQRTRYKVVSGSSGDVLVSGEVLGYGAFPNTIIGGKASSYTITVGLRVVVTDTRTGEVLFQNPSLSFRENFELAPNSAEFVPEEPAAVDRVAGAFASSLVASLISRKP